ncbi:MULTISPECIES: ABC transporter permease [unclassified Rhizobium]|jgi:phospholipid/cholesterol/gamma-HCH transport system permease protein|uniref:ABC transporter permease n=1 Tax=unclassified Rhizobium TaxID=2613769 RepID=UPI000648244A|nr:MULTISPECIES: ABC transporter permease [unclassified Rhizobium]MBN8951586.1 ABC transporter permease [Rhizobium tropici]OJY67679.1 MAG: organic solvent ABC transporter permease [Rhizobium sp. 60-20]RKD60152.1 phospholipid/cholesterol/gamma-HCH transport system permease protein [Rhizobium sp. WW_1]
MSLKAAEQSSDAPKIDDAPEGAGHRYRLEGNWRSANVHGVLRQIEQLSKRSSGGEVVIDLSGLSDVDTAGALLIRRLKESQEAHKAHVTIEGSNPHIDELLTAFDAYPDDETATRKSKKSLAERVFAPIGESVYEIWGNLVAAMYILGSAVRGAQLKFGRGSGVSPASIINQIDHMAVRAVPIILLMSSLIGAIIAQQGAFQLRYFGAEIFVVDLVGILQLREIGVLLTAIMIAGRSGSAITAEIGSMKMREEVDALKVMGLNPIGVLIFPRLVALTVALPLLTVIANFAALFGAALVSWAYSGITFATFISRLHEAVSLSTIISGMIKAPFMALVIGIVAAVEGLKVGGSAESLGQHVTSSVVKSIFVVILMDGLFAMFYAAIDF